MSARKYPNDPDKSGNRPAEPADDDNAAGGDNTAAQNRGEAPGTGGAGEGVPADGGAGTTGGDTSGTGR